MEKLMTPSDVCNILQIDSKLLNNWRYNGKGPKSIKFSNKLIRYRPSDVERFINGMGI